MFVQYLINDVEEVENNPIEEKQNKIFLTQQTRVKCYWQAKTFHLLGRIVSFLQILISQIVYFVAVLREVASLNPVFCANSMSL